MEDRFLENAQAALFLASFFLGLVALFRQRKKREKLTGALIAFLGLTFFLDEISFGERLFSIEMPVVYLLQYPRQITVMGEVVHVELPRTVYPSEKDFFVDLEKWYKTYRASHPLKPWPSERAIIRAFKFDGLHDIVSFLAVAYGWKVAFVFLAMLSAIFVFVIRKMRPHPAVPYVLICMVCLAVGASIDLFEPPIFWMFLEELSEFNGSLALLFAAAAAHHPAD